MIEKSDLPVPGLGAVISIERRLSAWFLDLALPLWDEHGVDRSGGGYHEHLAAGSHAPEPPEPGGLRRGRVVARQIYVFDVARRLGWRSAHTDPVDHGCAYLFTHLRRSDGAFHTAVHATSREGAGAFSLYEQAFYLFALARVAPSSAQRHPIEQTALDCLFRLRRDLGREEGGFEESTPPSLPLCSNPHMHLLEAALEWIGVSSERNRADWVRLADELVILCLTRFSDAHTGAIREYFDSAWQAWSAAGDRRHVVEPGHQFEWAWLLMQWVSSGQCPPDRRAACRDAAARLMEIGETHGVDPARGVAINEIWDDFTVKDAAAKLWPQTERLKAWCAMLAQASSAAEAQRACEKIDAAAQGIAGYLPPDLAGLWHETLDADGAFVVGPSKASSFYHVVCAIEVLRQTVSAHSTSCGVLRGGAARFDAPRLRLSMIPTDQLTNIRVLCIGDVMLDRFVSGQVKRISPESPVPVLSISGTTTVPGGAANVARNIGSLGGVCTLVSVVGEDAVARELQATLQSIAGITCEFSVTPGRPTSEKIRFVAQGQHMLRADAEVTSAIDAASVRSVIGAIERLAPLHDVMVLSDYAKGLLTDDVVRSAIATAARHGLPVVVDPKSVDLRRYAGATVITPNSKEVLDATGIDPTDDDARAEAAGAAILRDAGVDSVLLTRAHRGMTLVGAGRAAVHIEASAREVFDVVGAGDTVIATLALALGARMELDAAARLANFAAGVVVGKRGTATVTQTELADEALRLSRGSLQALQNKIMSREDAIGIAQTWRKNGFKVGFTNGCFDILHVGHLAILSFSRQNCGRLIVAVNSDASVRRLKEAGRPINSEDDRAMVLAALSVVDAVVVFDEDTPLQIIENLNPDVLVKGADYSVEQIVGSKHVLSYGGKVLTCELVAGKSTTRVVNVMRGKAGTV